MKVEDTFISLQIDKVHNTGGMGGKQMLSHMRMLAYNKPTNLREIKQVKKTG